MKKQSVLCKRYERLLNRIEELIEISLKHNSDPDETMLIDTCILNTMGMFKYLKERKQQHKKVHNKK